MWLRFLLVVCVIAINSTGSAYALDSSRLKLKILPLECLTDVVDDGLHIYSLNEHPDCGNPPPKTISSPDKSENEAVPSITYLNSSASPDAQKNNAPNKVETPNKLSVAYNVVFNGLHQRQSVLQTVIISLSTISTISFIAFILKFL